MRWTDDLVAERVKAEEANRRAQEEQKRLQEQATATFSARIKSIVDRNSASIERVLRDFAEVFYEKQLERDPKLSMYFAHGWYFPLWSDDLSPYGLSHFFLPYTNSVGASYSWAVWPHYKNLPKLATRVVNPSMIVVCLNSTPEGQPHAFELFHYGRSNYKPVVTAIAETPVQQFGERWLKEGLAELYRRTP